MSHCSIVCRYTSNYQSRHHDHYVQFHQSLSLSPLLSYAIIKLLDTQSNHNLVFSASVRAPLRPTMHNDAATSGQESCSLAAPYYTQASPFYSTMASPFPPTTTNSPLPNMASFYARNDAFMSMSGELHFLKLLCYFPRNGNDHAHETPLLNMRVSFPCCNW